MFPLYLPPHFSFKGQNYILFTAEPRTCSLLLLRAESLNSPLDTLFPKGISWLEGCETSAMQGGAVQPRGLASPERGPLQMRSLSGAAALWSRLQQSWE